ncbi:MAG: hypothetical protein ABT11_00550 [Novosphingobium sp. SCN 66-18]|nr:MAG: hypothetical protein ABT11_00550 [Novosphingobium sp. SCN 66-18]
MRALRLLPLFLALAAPAARGQGGERCAPDSDLAYVCDAQKPEDVLAIPGTPWLVASGFAPGAGLKLVDTRNRTLARWFTGEPAQIAADRQDFAQCPGPLDPALFNARGLSLRAAGRDRWRLLVVNHGGRETIEAFDVATDGAKPRLTWRGCLPMPRGQVGNSVAAFADGTVLVTVLTRPGTTIADFVEGRPTGAVWQWRPGDSAFAQLAGTELPGNNGLEVDPDQRHFYVVAFGWHAVVMFDRSDTRVPLARIEAPDFMPDNIHWTGGRLLLAGMQLDEPACGGLRKVVDGVADPMLCHRGWVVGEVDRTHRRIATVAYGRPQPNFNGLSAAAIVGRELWLGSFQSARIGIVPMPEPSDTPASGP